MAIDHSSRALRRTTAALLLAQFAAMWGTLFVLGPSIGWPGSLDLPAEAMLPVLLDAPVGAFAGYALYLVQSLLLVPLAVLLAAAFGMGPVLGRVAVAFGVLAGAFKALGIVRWLFVMPKLAESYVDPAADEATRTAIAVTFDALNAYSGGLGEIMGVGLFVGIWTVLLSIGLLRQGGAARPLGWVGVVAALLVLSTMISILGVDAGPVPTVAQVVWQFWSAALAVWLLRGQTQMEAV